MAKNWEHAAGILWPVLTRATEDRRTLYYKDLAPLIDTNDRNVRRGLGPIMYYCQDFNLPPLTSIVINKNTRLPGQGFTAWNIDQIDGAHREVYKFNWNTEINPYGGFGKDDTTEILAEELIENPGRSDEIYAKVRVRGTVQSIFRKALLVAYDCQCSICGLGFEEALEAAHIIPWAKSSPAERISPCNGLLLCANHHKLLTADGLKSPENTEFLVPMNATKRKNIAKLTNRLLSDFTENTFDCQRNVVCGRRRRYLSEGWEMVDA